MRLIGFWLVLIGLWGAAAPAAHAQDRANCRSTIAGITYCVADGGRTHVLIVDLTHPNLRVQTVMANDLLDVRPPDVQRERVVEMARRYRAQGAVILINGDYFGIDRGPEGPTVVQGRRLDTAETIRSNPSRYRRSTLALARFGAAAIGYLPPIGSLPPAVYADTMFNVISGGPIILRDGQPQAEALACLMDRIPAATCRRDRQTAVGLDASRRTLYLSVSTTRSTRALAELLRDYGAADALKLDAGGSSQLWYNGRALLDSDRGVANALAVFVEDRARHDAAITLPSAPQIVEAQSTAAIEVTASNTGFLDWRPELGYGLRRIEGGSLIDRNFKVLPLATEPGEISRMFLNVHAGNRPGVYESTWQMSWRGQEDFGERAPVRIIVVPRGEDRLRAEVQRVIAGLTPRTFERDWPQAAAQIRQMIRSWERDEGEK